MVHSAAWQNELLEFLSQAPLEKYHTLYSPSKTKSLPNS
jgi:hypothetical protein